MPVRRRHPQRRVLPWRAPGIGRQGHAAAVRLPLHRLRGRLYRRLAPGPDPRAGRRRQCRGRHQATASGRRAAIARLHQLPDAADRSAVHRHVGGDRPLPAEPADQLGGVRASVPADHADTDLLSNRDLGVQRLRVDQPGAARLRRAGAGRRRGPGVHAAAQPSGTAIARRPHAVLRIRQQHPLEHRLSRSRLDASGSLAAGLRRGTARHRSEQSAMACASCLLGHSRHLPCADDRGLSSGLVVAVAPRRSRHPIVPGEFPPLDPGEPRRRDADLVHAEDRRLSAAAAGSDRHRNRADRVRAARPGGRARAADFALCRAPARDGACRSRSRVARAGQRDDPAACRRLDRFRPRLPDPSPARQPGSGRPMERWRHFHHGRIDHVDRWARRLARQDLAIGRSARRQAGNPRSRTGVSALGPRRAVRRLPARRVRRRGEFRAGAVAAWRRRGYCGSAM